MDYNLQFTQPVDLHLFSKVIYFPRFFFCPYGNFSKIIQIPEFVFYTEFEKITDTNNNINFLQYNYYSLTEEEENVLI